MQQAAVLSQLVIERYDQHSKTEIRMGSPARKQKKTRSALSLVELRSKKGMSTLTLALDDSTYP